MTQPPARQPASSPSAEILPRLTALAQELAGAARPAVVMERLARALVETFTPDRLAIVLLEMDLNRLVVAHCVGPAVATAWADDGLIEAAEFATPGEPWMLAVQWHPEDLTEAALFAGFARALARAPAAAR